MKGKNVSKIFLVILACLVAYIFLLPLLFMFFTSFKGVAESVTSRTLLPKAWTLENYRELFMNTATSPILLWLFNTVIVTVAGTALRITVSVLAAYSLARLPLPGKSFLLVSLIWAMAVPEIVTYFPLFYTFKLMGGLNTFWPLILPSGSGVMCIYLIYNFLLAFPQELEEAGFVEGANVFQVLWHIVLPSVKPVVITQAFITFLGLYNSYLWPSLVINRNETRTITLGIAALVLGENYTNPGMMMASTVISVLPVMVIFMFANKYIVKGFTQSGIK
ncbi:carbohydrate ABC transporter permease [Lacrimispora saccharolytica]|uniref:Binding-protein-dependent transport systems inner membrane component n=1 Tax=Lacrimispora saccharolytica (strain ATCC 35040 / DSM 2544 / NRCC 2533 / WM1) TaxID=610130 RepID=D9R799_LACSW|nr:carbohydrate ABC transporter permease [Lacrimispora saccharolytica]ADL05531.1 binding-protein-dependent transport systems inner membrane component [[Clostridium] saccharolyticum WM1]QRV20308.1 carbohydrate ABC transporter permease [Lacrimispora saccharolytica]